MRVTSLIDLIIFGCVLFWGYKFYEFKADDNEGFSLNCPGNPYHRFMQKMLEENKSGHFHFDYLLALIVFAFWIRFLLMLNLTRTFGPLIKVIGAMIKDLIIFLALFFIILIAFSYIGVLAFGSIPQYENITQALILNFTSSLGDWNLSIYNNMSPEKQMIATLFHLVVILVTMLILMNLVIAIMSDTYARLTEVKLGLYSQGIIEAMPVYKNDKRYGALISATPPFNVLIFLLTPLFLIIKDKDALEVINSFLLRVCYLPVVLVTTCIFIVANLLMLPFAYFKILIHKFLLLIRTNQSECLKNAMVWMLFGLLILFMNQITDLFYFLKLSFMWDQNITI